MELHGSGYLEGPGWVANAFSGAFEIFTLVAFLEQQSMQSEALSILDHVLEGGFIDESTGFYTRMSCQHD